MSMLEDLMAALPELGEDGFALISSTLARAIRFAPCIVADDFTYAEAAMSVLVDVIRRRDRLNRAKVVPGVATTKQIGNRSLSVSATGVSEALFEANEIAELQSMCAAFNGSVMLASVPQGSFPDAKPWPC